MVNLMSNEKINVIKEYLSSSFPDCTIFCNTDIEGHIFDPEFQVCLNGISLKFKITYEALGSNTSNELSILLQQLKIAQEMKNNYNKGVVTLYESGLQIKPIPLLPNR